VLTPLSSPDRICHAPTDEDTPLPFSLPNICKKKVTAAFDGGQVSSDGGIFILAAADKRLGLIDTLAGLIPDARDPAQITHSMADILRERVFAIACGYPDGNDLDDLRGDPAFKMACGRLPDSSADLASQPTISRLENAPNLRDLIRMSRGMVDFWCESHPHPPNGVGIATAQRDAAEEAQRADHLVDVRPRPLLRDEIQLVGTHILEPQPVR
jgi:Transposase DDE domain group 1